ncbi:hypothetical protein AAMO2058_001046700 [Amorphochlora amoebiformis]
MRKGVLHPTLLLQRLTKRRARIMGLDIGDRYVGIAVSDDGNRVANGLPTIQRKVERVEIPRRPGERRPLRNRKIETVRADLERLVRKYRVAAIVAGLPDYVDRRPSEQSKRTCRFVEEMAEGKGILSMIPVYWQHELYSSAVARDQLRERGFRDFEAKKELIDQMAACRILQSFLNKYGDGIGI